MAAAPGDVYARKAAELAEKRAYCTIPSAARAMVGGLSKTRYVTPEILEQAIANPAVYGSGWWGVRATDPFEDATAMYYNERAYVRILMNKAEKMVFVRTPGSNPLLLLSDIRSEAVKSPVGSRSNTITTRQADGGSTDGSRYVRILISKEQLNRLHNEDVHPQVNDKIRCPHPDFVVAEGFLNQTEVRKARRYGYVSEVEHLFTNKYFLRNATLRFRTDATFEDMENLMARLDNEGATVTARNGALRICFRTQIDEALQEEMRQEVGVKSFYPDNYVGEEKPYQFLLKALAMTSLNKWKAVAELFNAEVVSYDFLSAKVALKKGAPKIKDDEFGKVREGVVVTRLKDDDV